MAFDAPSFLFLFLPLTVLLYYLIPGSKGKNAVLLAASLLFYSVGDLRYLPLLLGSAAVHYAAGRISVRHRERAGLVTGIVVSLDVLTLLAFKWKGTLPLGLSFYTFQAISYVVDVKRDEKNGAASFCLFLQYLTFFPQISCGPIVPYRDLASSISQRETDAKTLSEGLIRFVKGLSKKVILAAGASAVANAVYGADSAPGTLVAWLGVIAYCLQLYFDFSGYSDMAIGLGRAFGFTLPENFQSPYCADSISNFWRRWHISLSSWFRDYVYIPLGGSREGTAKTCRNKLIVFLLTGLWHGMGWTFLLWGLWHGLLSVLETLTNLPKKLAGKWYGHVYCLLCVAVGFAVFRANSIGQAGTMLKAMFCYAATTAQSLHTLVQSVGRQEWCCALLSLLFCLPLKKHREKSRAASAAEAVAALVLLALCMMRICASGFQPFIYAQF